MPSVDFVYAGKGSGRPPKDVVSAAVAPGVTELEDLLFDQCSSLRDLKIPEGVARIGDYAFHKCSSLKYMSLPESVREVGWSAFNGCTNLERLDLPEGLEAVGNRAFKGCERLDPFRWPGQVIRTGFGLFDGCANLHSLGGAEDKDGTDGEFHLGLPQDSLLDLLKDLSSVGDVYILNGEFEVARAYFERMIRERTEAFGKDHLLTLDAKNRLALVCTELLDYSTSLSLYNAVVSGFSSTLGPRHPSTLAALGDV
eukprot:CAMPEP_0197553982 /NCGR_PEP_ID=MMETSP1320-20131121/10317_1 /TAXON_ID=91990 /ORGANISM="Bolidomonas sp., Strain RCC2347" /LENGTH=254 /DNA_ID=CAMNT_0043114823 /DNA_START=67 /DNA_END=828 /DNA_ORIENTATION=+